MWLDEKASISLGVHLSTKCPATDLRVLLQTPPLLLSACCSPRANMEDELTPESTETASCEWPGHPPAHPAPVSSKQPDCKLELREVADSRTTDLHSKERVPARQNPTGKQGNKQRFIPTASHTNFYSALIYINFMITASQNYYQLALSWKIAFR